MYRALYTRVEIYLCAGYIIATACTSVHAWTLPEVGVGGTAYYWGRAAG